MAIKIYCDKANEFECIKHMIECGLLNPSFRDANSYKEKFNLDEDKLSVEYGVKEFTNKGVLELNENDITFLKCCIYFMRSKLKNENEQYEEQILHIEKCAIDQSQKHVYSSMVEINKNTINKCNEWMERLDNI